MPAPSLNDLRKLQRNQLNRVKKDDLIEAILSASNESLGVTERLENRLADIAKELTELKQSINSSKGEVDNRIKVMEEKIEVQANIIQQQQKFLENLDRKERETNVVILGVPDEGEALDGATDDAAKIRKLFSVVGDEPQVRSYRRLGRHNETSERKRPILVTLADRGERDRMVSNARTLKERGAPFDRIYVKKDLHPAVREEWKRLHTAHTTEKNRPENQGCQIRLDMKERKLYRDGCVIDEWKLNYF